MSGENASSVQDQPSNQNLRPYPNNDAALSRQTNLVRDELMEFHTEIRQIEQSKEQERSSISRDSI